MITGRAGSREGAGGRMENPSYGPVSIVHIGVAASLQALTPFDIFLDILETSFYYTQQHDRNPLINIFRIYLKTSSYVFTMLF
jgi:hypothetical protein